jgi:hypothetical protein
MPVGTPFQPGQSGNAAGRPKGSLGLKSILRRLLNTTLKNEPDPLGPDSFRDMSVGEKAELNLVISSRC